MLHVLLNKYDIVHLHHAESGFITPFIAIKSKVVVTFHGVYNYENPKFSKLQNKFFKFSERLNIKYADRVISVSKPNTVYLERKFNRRIRYIPNGINNTTNNDLMPQQIPQKPYIFFAAGRIYQIKGLHLVINAIKKIKPKETLIVAGDMEQVSAYKDEIYKIIEGVDIDFVGLIKDKDKLMLMIKNASLFVFPSYTEAMSMMLLEVVSMKIPVIASDIPANKAIFTENEMLFFKSGSVVDLKDKLQYALTNSAKMERMAAKAFDKLEKDYLWETIARKYINVFNNLVN